MLLLLVWLAACDDQKRKQAPSERPVEQPASRPAEPISAERVAKGRAVVETFECSRCHSVPGIKAALTKDSCVGCHQAVIDGTYEAPKSALARWQQNIVHLRQVPSLAGVGERFRRDWLVEFLQEPHDLRPNIGAMMPRMNISEADANAIADFLGARDSASNELARDDAGEAGRGRELLESKGCATCHGFTGVARLSASPIPVEMSPDQMSRAMVLAPDLRHTRERYRPKALVDWLLEPTKLYADAAMPDIPLTRAEASDIAAYILTAELDAKPKLKVPERLPVLEREVAFAEVEERVFKKVCWHCHSDPAFNAGDGGPGNTGGFGFDGRGLSLASYRSMMAGSLDDHGARKSVFRTTQDGTPLLVAAMHARHSEVAGQPVDGLRGMPLGLPPMSLEDIQLVESWIAQGRPR